MMEVMMIAEARSLADLTAQHQMSLQVSGEIANRWRIVEDNMVRLCVDDENALASAREKEMHNRAVLLAYTPADAREALQKALYVTALMIAEGKPLVL